MASKLPVNYKIYSIHKKLLSYCICDLEYVLNARVVTKYRISLCNPLVLFVQFWLKYFYFCFY